MFAYEKLPGLPRERVLDAIAPVLRAYGLVGVELVWRTDGQGRVLVITLESPDAVEPGQGVTLDVCSRFSRDLSTALDVAGLLDGKYRLEVGSPGLERKLYTLADYQRFQGRLAKVKAVIGNVVAAPAQGFEASGLAETANGPAEAVDDEPPALATSDDVDHSPESGAEPTQAEPAQGASRGGARVVVLTGKLGGVDDRGQVLIVADGATHTLEFQNIRSGQLVVDWQEMGFAPRQRAGRRPAAQGRK